jgi:hypothetical protein
MQINFYGKIENNSCFRMAFRVIIVSVIIIFGTF